MAILIPFLAILAFATLISLGLGIFTLWVKPPAGRFFVVMVLGSALWSAAYGFELYSTTEQGKLTATVFTFLGALLTTPAWVFFAIDHTGNRQWLTPGRILLIVAPMVFILAFQWTNSWHNLFWKDFYLDTSGPFPATGWEGGPFFWAATGYSYTLVVAGIVIRINSILSAPQAYRGQIWFLVLSALLPLTGSILNITRLSPFPSVDPTSLAFSLSSIIYAFIIFRGKLFNMIPIARNMIIENMTEGVVILDNEGRIVDVNPAGELLLGQSADMLIGKPGEQVLPGSNTEDYRHLAQTTQEISLSEVYHSDRYFEVRVTPIYNRWGDLSGRLFDLRDITAERDLQQQIRQQIKETMVLNQVMGTLNSSISRNEVLTVVCTELAQALGLPQSAVAILNEEQTELEVLAEYLEKGRSSALGISLPVEGNILTEEILATGRTLTVKDVRTDPRTAKIRHLFEQRGTISLLIAPLTLRNQIRGTLGLDSIEPREFTPQEIALVERVAATVSQALENMRLYQALQEELVERRRAQAELVIARDTANQSNKAKSTFLASMSHELRTPLNSIIGYTDLLLQGIYGEINDIQIERLNTVRRNGRHLLNLINDILDLAKIESGRLELRPEPMDVSMIVFNCLASLKPIADEKGLGIDLQISESLPQVVADPGRIAQVFTNILNNAIKFTDEGEVTVVAEVKRTPNGQPLGAQIAISDTGIGIAEEDRALIFDEFRQVDLSSTREYEGTGLGLAICRKLLILMRGQIWVKSVPGEGSTFYILLPLADESII